MAQNGAENPLTGKQRQAAVLSAEDELSDETISAQLGIGRSTLRRWRELPLFRDAVAEHTAELERQTLRLAIARKRERLKVLDSLHSKSLALMTARAEQYADVPGGDTGLIVGQLKQVRHISESPKDDGPQTWTEEHWEYSADIGLMREIRATQEQAAKELGQWVDRSESFGAMTSTIQIVGVDAGDV